MSWAVPFCTARGVCWMEALCCAAEYVDKQTQQPIKRTLSRKCQLRLVAEEGNEEASARRRLRRMAQLREKFRRQWRFQSEKPGRIRSSRNIPHHALHDKKMQ